jgi:lipopolysaccharide export LptBFGC system permease protein LptF
MRRSPWTLWRACTAEMLRLLVVAAGVVVLLIALGAAVKPISDGLLSASDALTFITLAIPPMLAYALPLAGGFASTLVYHRMATDLEAVAAHAGGISHRALLAPALAVGLLCSASLVVLNEEVIPRFLERMQRLVTVDVARLIARQVERGQSVAFRDIMLHADAARSVPPPEGSGVIDQLLLTGFAGVVLRDGTPAGEATAARAKIWLLPAPAEGGVDERGLTRLVLQMEDVVAWREGSGVAASENSRLVQVIPDTFRDNVKFLSWRDLARIERTPERLNWVEPKRRALALALARVHGEGEIESAVRDAGRLRLLDERGHDVLLRAAHAAREGDAFVLRPPEGGAVVASFTRPGADEARPEHLVAAAEGARLTFEELEPDLGPRLALRLELRNARVRAQDRPGENPPLRALVALGGLSLPGDRLAEFLAMPSRALVEAARPLGEHNPLVRERLAGVHGLEGALRRLHHDVLAKRHERMALAASCLVMVLCGAVAALQLSTRLPLVVYLFTFAPAMAAMVTISGGQQVTVVHGAWGLVLMWSGVAGLALYTLAAFLRLARH